MWDNTANATPTDATPTEATMPTEEARTAGRIVVLDDDVAVLGALTRVLRRAGHEVIAISDPYEAIARVKNGDVDVLVSDVSMPELDGIGVLHAVQGASPVVPVILVSGAATMDTAMRALDERAFALLSKPCDLAHLRSNVSRTLVEARTRRARKAEEDERNRLRYEDIARRHREWTLFDAALEQVFMVYQPICKASTRTVIGYEALVRSRHPEINNPGLLFAAAHRLGREQDLGRRIRNLAVQPFADLPIETMLFLNILKEDLEDETFADAASPLMPHAHRLILELSEESRATREVSDRLAEFRAHGMRVAIDDLGAGYASLNSVAELEPEVIKLDMVLVRDVHLHPVRQRLVRALVSAAIELDVEVIAEGVETPEELACLRALGCDLFQGYLLARPAPTLTTPSMEPFDAPAE